LGIKNIETTRTMKIIHLINDAYQVVIEDEQTIIFQGSEEQCLRYLLKQATRTMKYFEKYLQFKQQEQ
jgi:alpha-D-ribose 1-methylphosphonate 5-phosphate C-P lyase